MSEGPKKIIEDITEGFAEHGYICSEQIATAVYLASELEKPNSTIETPFIIASLIISKLLSNVGWHPTK